MRPISPIRPAAIVLLGLTLTLVSCPSTVRIRLVPVDTTYAWIQRGLPVSDEPSAGTLQFLRLHGLDPMWRDDPAAALRALNITDELGVAGRFSIVELSLLVARRSRARAHGDRLRLYLDTAARAWGYLFDPRPDGPAPAFDRNYAPALMIYADAVARVVEVLATTGAVRDTGTTIAVGDSAGAFALFVGRGDWRFDEFSSLVPADRFTVEGLPERFIRYGLGAPFAGLLAPDASVQASAFYPPRGLAVPVTALIRFAPADRDDPGQRCAVLELVDPSSTASLEVGGHSVPVAADFTAPYGYLASLGEHEIRTIGTKGMFSPSSTGSFHRLIFMEPYDPEKTPLVLVHGLGSDPSTWLALTTSVEGAPVLRRSYQVWYFIYPSGEPFLWTAAMLRDSLEEVRRSLDPGGVAPAMHSMVLVGHSMGGLLVKTTVADSGDRLWDTVFTVPPGAIELPETERAALENALFFEPKPYVRRVIFLSTPQRGCTLARSLRGRIASALITLPQAFSDMLRSIALHQPASVTPRMRAILKKGGADAVRVLRPDNPMMRAFATIPIAPGVPYHTILGNHGGEGADQSGDGVVSYTSGHLDGAASEAVVACDHHSTSCQAAINEVLRILREDVDHHRVDSAEGRDLGRIRRAGISEPGSTPTQSTSERACSSRSTRRAVPPIRRIVLPPESPSPGTRGSPPTSVPSGMTRSRAALGTPDRPRRPRRRGRWRAQCRTPRGWTTPGVDE